MGLSLDLFGDWPVYGPEGGDGLPGVVILHGSEGPMAGWSHRFAAILAGHGFLALPYGYGEGDFWGAGAIRDVPLEPVLEAVAVLKAYPRCAGAGLFGWSKGGEMALLFASLLNDRSILPCVAAHAPSDHVQNAFDPKVMRAGGDWLAVDPAGPRAWTWPAHASALVPGAMIEIERYHGAVFLSVGLDDQIRDPAEVLALAERLEAAGKPAETFFDPGQDHGFTFDREPELWHRLTRFFSKHLTEE